MEQMRQNKQEIFRGNHPSGIEDEGELAFVSMEFWIKSDGGAESIMSAENAKFDRLLSFQQGWQACKDYYKLNT